MKKVRFKGPASSSTGLDITDEDEEVEVDQEDGDDEAGNIRNVSCMKSENAH